MVESAAARALRLIDLVPYLVAHPGSKVKDVAQVFDITVAELLKDLEILFMCGLPGYTPLELIDLSVEGGVISIRDPQNLESPRRFTEAESLVLRVALAALEEVLPVAKRSSVVAIRNKVANLFKGDVPNESLYFQSDPAKMRMDQIRQALRENRKIKIVYLNKVRSQKSTRNISIQRILVERERVLIEAWCDSSSGLRTFNLNQIESAEVTSETAIQGVIAEERHGISVSFATKAESTFTKEFSEQIQTVNGESRMEIFQTEWMVRQVLSEGGNIVISEPDSIRKSISDRAILALKNY